MKKVFGGLLFGILCLCLTGCEIKTTIKDTAELNEADGVSMTIKKDTLTRTSATIIITDTNGKEANIYGTYYRIDRKENEKWKEVEHVHDDILFTDEGYIVDDNGKLEFELDWEYAYGSLEKGDYRIVKDTFPNLERAVTESDKMYFSVEFSIVN